ncbi:NADP-dependent oxidoreductase [Leuconostoc rapi]|uniref:NADP-dependent oxidoreductase n=1 Tax=Leuconostoc rapi TaxID=1406906 RepID=UPI00195C8987|nr:NADP-dependent oxidoreductase [Leuconostoc rapi]MBM7435922.1 NADPH:quinone reductase-like Zn-dependent oxidoreductase [Leuconostoc rapi]
MYAIEMNNYGDVGVLVETKTAPKPEIKPNQLLVKQHATAIDPYDVKFRQGLMGSDREVPLIPGSSVAGEVVALGAEVTGFSIGDRVAASPHLKSYAEYVALGRSSVAKIPENVSYPQAAAVVLGAQTGYQVVTKDLDIKPEESVLILGGSGSVGLTALQVAKLRGASDIYTTAIGAGVAFLKSFDDTIHVIDSHAQPLTTTIPDGVDAILDPIGGASLTESLGVLKPSGRLVSIAGNADDARVTNTYLSSNGAQLEALLKLISDAKIKVVIAEVAPFNVENLKKFQALKHVLGKLVLTFE